MNKFQGGRYQPSLILFFAFIFIFSCKENEQHNGSQNQTVSLHLDNSIKSNLSNAYSSIEYILLEDSDEFPLIRPVKILMSEGKIGIEDRGGEKYNFYDFNGNFLFAIQAKGDGPGEFIRTEDFQIFSDSIKIKDPYLGKMLTFSPNGEFIREERSTLQQGNFYEREKSTIFYTKNSFDLGEYHFVFDSGDYFTGKVPADPRLEGLVHSGKDGFIYDKYRDNLIFNIPFGTSTAIFDSENQIDKIIRFDFGKNNASREDFFKLDHAEFYEKAKDQNWVREISSFYPLEDGYFLRIFRGGKESHEIFFDNDFKILAQYNVYKNDIDFMPIRNLPWFSYNNKIGYLIPSYLFLNDYKKKFNGSEVIKKRGNVHSFVEQNINELGNDTYVLVLLKVNSEMFN